MTRMLLISFFMSLFTSLLVINPYAISFAEEGTAATEKKVRIVFIFTENGWEPEDKGTGPDKWVKQPDGHTPEGEILYDQKITVYKKNPCTVCGPSGCYVKQNC